jgi:uridine phosphorylase
MRASALVAPGTALPASELVLDDRGAVYHLGLRPEELARTVVLVGDPDRVQLVAEHLTQLGPRRCTREFVSVTGYYHSKPITVLSTGIGTDNMDIVLTEMDALVNVDLEKRTPKEEHVGLDLIRLGTCGSMDPRVGIGQRVVSAYAIGLDNVLSYYAAEPSAREEALLKHFLEHVPWPHILPLPYCAQGDANWVARLAPGNTVGITLTAGGFYAAQGRQVRLRTAQPRLNDRMASFTHEGLAVVNYEMETSALYGLAGLLGHRACTVCTVVADRHSGEKRLPTNAISDMIAQVLDRSTG